MAIEGETAQARQEPSNRTIRDLIAFIVENPDFASEICANPEKYQQRFNLSNKAVFALRGIRPEDFEFLGNMDAKSFAAGAATAAWMARDSFSPNFLEAGQQGEVSGGDTCYYLG